MTTPVSRYVEEVRELRADVRDLKHAFHLVDSVLHSLYDAHRRRIEHLERVAGLTWDPRKGSYE